MIYLVLVIAIKEMVRVGVSRPRRKSTLMILFTIALVVVIGLNGIITYYVTYTIRNDAELINKLGLVRGSIQRLLKLELSGISNAQLIIAIDEVVADLSEEGQKYFESEDLASELLRKLWLEWADTKQAIENYNIDRSEKARQILLEASDQIWLTADDAVEFVQGISEKKIQRYNIVFVITFIVVVGTVVMLFWLKKYVHDDLEHVVRYDVLTGATTRNYYNLLLQREVERSRRYKRPLSLIVIDFDGFKHINDTHGHDYGDYVLQTISESIMGSIRETDVFSRIGGDEFVVITPETTSDEAVKLCEKLCQIVSETRLKKGVKITVSMGVAELQSGESIDSFFIRADQALYEAKATNSTKVQ